MRSVYPAHLDTPGATGLTEPVWIDLLQPSPQEVAAVQSKFGLAVPTREQLDEIETSSRLRVTGNTLYLSMPLSTRHEAQDSAPTPIGFVLSPQVLVTVRYVQLHAFDQGRARIEKGGDRLNSSSIFAVLLEEMVDVAADMLERIAAQLGAISRRAFSGSRRRPSQAMRASRMLQEMLNDVGDAGEHLSWIRESLTALQRIAAFTAESAADWLQPELQTRLKTQRLRGAPGGQGAIPAGRGAGLHHHLAERYLQSADHCLGGGNPADADCQHVWHELPQHARAQLGVGLWLRPGSDCTEHHCADCVVQAPGLVVTGF